MKAVCFHSAPAVLALLFAAISGMAQVPVITGFSPAEGSVGTAVQIIGTNLLPVTAIEFNGVAAESAGSVNFPVVAVVPPGATTGPITLRTPLGVATSPAEFIVRPIGPPVVHSFSPTEGSVGTQVQIIGTNLLPVTAIEFNGVPAEFTGSVNFPVVAVVPAGATTGRITLRTPLGVATSPAAFIVRPIGPPVVHSFSPAEGAVNTAVQLTGTNFQGLVSISFGGVETMGVLMLDFAAVRVPTNAVTGPITITTTNGSFTTKEIFTVLPPPPPAPPVINYFLPWDGEPGTEVRIYGAGFESATEVQVNGTSVVFNADDLSTIRIVIPPDATTGPIKVVSPEGSATSGRHFTVVPKPILTGFSPDQGPPGTAVKLLGSHLDQIVRVRLGSVPVTYDRMQQAFTVPLDALSAPVTIASAYSESTSAATFTVTHDNDLGAITTVSMTNPVAPATLHYRVTITNKGSEPVRGVRLVDRFVLTDNYVTDGLSLFPEPLEIDAPADSRIEIIGASASQGQCLVTNGVVLWNTETLGASQTAAVEIWLRAASKGVVYQFAKVNSSASDPDPRDNQRISTELLVGEDHLEIQRCGGSGLEIRWPSQNQDALLTWSDQVGGTDWKPVISSLVETNGWTIVTEQTTSAARLYRLELTGAAP